MKWPAHLPLVGGGGGVSFLVLIEIRILIFYCPHWVSYFYKTNKVNFHVYEKY